MSAKQKACIIGSGVAGMACAVRLAVHGFDITVFEKNNHSGGKLYKLEKDGYCFDTGPSLFVQPENIEELFTLADEDINEYLTYQPLDITCKYFYGDGTVINAYADKEKFANELQLKLNESPKNVIAYLNDSEKIYNNIGNIFLNNSLHKKRTWLSAKIFKALALTHAAYLFSSLHSFNKKKFKSKHLVQLFDRYATYNGSDPYKSPAMLKLISHLELSKGSFYPQGGMIAINNALYNLALKKGVQFKFNADVQHIITGEHEAKGVVVNDENHFADVVISNVDIYFTYLKLLNDVHGARQTLKQERSSSAIVFYWGMKKEFSQLQLHNIFFSDNYAEEFKCIFNTKQPYDDPTIYINITAKQEPGIYAPAGKENWFVMINVPSNLHMSDDDVINLYKKNIIAKLNRMLQTDIESLIETESILHPKKIEEYTASYLGALYGTSSNSRKAAFLRHPNFSKDIRRLYFAGGSVHPGGGIPLCLKSAAITSNLIIDDRKKWR